MRPWQHKLSQVTPFYYGWAVFGSAVVVGYTSRSLLAVATLSVFVVPMTEEFGWSKALFSGAVSIGGLGAAAISPLAGRLIDRHGSGVVVAASAAIAGAGAFGLSMVGQPWAFYLLYVPARAAFAGPLELGTATALSNWFIRRRPFVLALLSVWQGTGLAVMPLAAQFIIGGWGWRAGWAWLGAVTLLVGVLPVWLLMARRPEDLGLPADPPRAGSGQRSSEGLPETEWGNPPVTREGRPEVNLNVREALRTRAFWLLALFSVAGFMVQAGVSLHQVAHFIYQGMPAGDAALTAGVFAISQSVGGILWGTLARWAPLRFLMCLAGFTGAAGTLGIVASSTLFWGAAAALALGVAVGGYHLLLRLAYADYYGRRYLGSIRGLTIGAQIGGQVVGPVLAGAMYDATGSYWLPFLVIAAGVSAAGVAALAASPPGRGSDQPMAS